MKTNELTGAALDWAVAKCEGLCEGDFAWYYDRRDTFNYSTNWAQGGPIIEREKITLRIWEDEDYVNAYITDTKDWLEGPTPLIAAMRCYVASRLGRKIYLPEELTA